MMWMLLVTFAVAPGLQGRPRGSACWQEMPGLVHTLTTPSPTVVTLHVPLTREGPDATFHMVDRAFFAAMKPGAVLINSSRGAVVSEPDLKDAMRQYAKLEKELNTMLSKLQQRQDEQLYEKMGEALQESDQAKALGKKLAERKYRDAAEELKKHKVDKNASPEEQRKQLEKLKAVSQRMASEAERSRSARVAGMVALPGRHMPMASATQHMVLAVPRKEQEPQVGVAWSSSCRYVSWSILPSWSMPRPSVSDVVSAARSSN